MIQRRGPLKPASGTITAGGASQQILPRNNARAYVFVQNTSDTTQWLNFGAPATDDGSCIELTSGAWYENPPNFCPIDAVYIFGATTGKSFSVKEGTG